MIASARRQQQVDDTASEIEARGRKTLRRTSDVSDRASLEKLLTVTLEQFGKVDILVNCAGIIKRAATLDFPEEEWANILNTNLTGTFRVLARSSVNTCWSVATGASLVEYRVVE